jgi:hypothetical protein
MILYHFTAREYLRDIMSGGIWKGEVALNPTELRNAVWLTSDKSPDAHGLTDGRPLTPQEKALLGLPLDADARFPNKRAVRITVKVPASDRRLVRWRDWAGKRVEPSWLATLERSGGGAAKARTWFLYHGTIPAAWFTEILDIAAGMTLTPEAAAVTEGRGAASNLDPAHRPRN